MAKLVPIKRPKEEVILPKAQQYAKCVGVVPMLVIRSILLTRRRNKPNFKVETRGEEVRFVHDAASRTNRRV
jgi:hypothetical protein